MEYHLTKKTITGTRTVLDTCAEQSVDVDLTLPDYCPDIERILSCTLEPKVYMNNISGDRLTVEGSSCVRILYLDGDRGCLRAYEYAQPFSDSLPLKSAVDDYYLSVEAKPEYINCRALSPRKLSLHGAFSLCAKVIVPGALDYYGYEDGGDLQVKSERVAASSLCGLCSDSFSVQEDIPVNAKSGISAVLSHRLYAKITELKAIRDKIMLSAELKVELMYLCGVENPEAECMSYTIPVSRIVDCEGVTEEAVIDGELGVLGADVRLSDDTPDGSQLLLLDAKLCFGALCWVEKELDVLSDAFSTERETTLHEEPFSCRSGVTCRAYTDVGKANVGVDEEIGRVIDVHCEKLTASAVHHDNATSVYVKLCVGILYENGEGEKRYVERDAEFSYSPEPSGCEEILRLKAGLDSLSYRLTDSRHLELRAELVYRLTMCRRESCTALTSVSAEDDAPIRSKEGALILYYTDAGESVWDISKRFCSRPDEIIAENGLENDEPDGGMMLLIPTA